jgi:uncharacterized protein YbbC (DUF1343 family)
MSEVLCGLDRLRDAWPARLEGARLGLLAHPASVDRVGRPAAEVVQAAGIGELRALFGPEHGYFGWGGAGEEILDHRHPSLGLPVHSLYGAHRKPTPAMLAEVDVILFDLQDLAVRCYTFGATLRLLLEAAAEQGKTVVVLDRPAPLPDTLDGPALDPAFASFVALLPAPFVFGLTSGEVARWLKGRLSLDVDLRVIPLGGYTRRPAHRVEAAPWIPPSPGIRSWTCAYAYPATVFAEAFPSLDVDRAGTTPFQFLGAPGLNAAALAADLNARGLPGVAFTPEWRRRGETVLDGVRLRFTTLAAWRPVETALHLVAALTAHLGEDALWNAPGARPEWFDALFGTDRVRLALRAGTPPEEIARAWLPDLVDFAEETAPHRLYAEGDEG